MNMLEQVVLNSGYEKKDYGYFKVTENNTHWITLFSDKFFQMYAYYTNDPELEKVYDTGNILTAPEELQLLINIFQSNHK